MTEKKKDRKAKIRGVLQALKEITVVCGTVIILITIVVLFSR